MSLGYVDTAVFLVYLLAVVVLGFWVGRGRRGTSEEYFLAGRSVPWYAVGASFIGSNISTEHFIGMVGAAYVYGICVANWEWLNVWTFSILIWIFIPFLLATRVFSAPEFLERRYNGTCRLLFAVLTVVASVFAFLAAVLYAGAIGIDAIFDVQGFLQSRFGVSAAAAPMVATSLCVAALAVTTGSYAIFGGLRSVVWTDVFQVVVMFVGGILVTALGLAALGGGDPVAGWKTMVAANRGVEAPGAPASGYGAVIAESAGRIVPGATRYDRLSLIQPLNHKIVPWPTLLVIWLSVSIWYNCINQFMIQRVLAAKNAWHARMGIVFSGFMKIFLPLIIVIPGLVMFAMEPHLPDPDKSYPILVQRLVPVGLKGLLLATLFGAIQSTVSSVLNSASTVITLDIYRRFILRPAAGGGAAGGAEGDGGGDRRTVRVGLAVSTAVLVVAAALAPFIGLLQKGVFIYIQDLYAHFAPPFSAVFVVGLLWKRANARGATAAILAGLALSLLIALGAGRLPWLAPLAPFLVRATVVWFFCVAVIAGVSLLTGRPPAHKVTDETTINWRKLNIFGDLGTPWYRSVVLWWSLFVAGILVCYVVYSGAF
jgi:SSS family solute:Na+ symporter